MTGAEDAQPARDVAEALRYFGTGRAQIDAIRSDARVAQVHAATLVRAALAAAPLTADNIRDAHTAWVRLPLNEKDTWAGEESFVAARLSKGRGDVAAGADERPAWAALQEIVDSHDRSCDCERLLAEIAVDALAGARPAAEPDEFGTPGDGNGVRLAREYMDRPAGDASTESHVEYWVYVGNHRVFTTRDPDEVVSTLALPQFADRTDMSSTRVTVTATRTETPWKAEQA